MTAERESMTLQEMGAPALGSRSVATRPPGRSQPRAANAGPGGRGQAEEAQFTAQYRLRILEEAESCTQPGEVGRLLRREGLYSSHLTEWRRARREGSLQGLTPSKRGRKPAERNPLSAKVHELERKCSAGEGAAHRPYDPGRPGKVAGLLDSASNTGRTADGRPAARIAGRRGAGVPSAGGATGFLLPSSEARRSRASAAPSYARPGPACVRTRARPRRARQPRFVDRSPAEVVATLLDEGRYLCAERTMYRILAANQPVRERRNQRSHPCYTKPSWWPRGPTRPGPGTSPGSGGPNAGRPSTSMSCSTSSAATSWAGMVADRENAALAATLIEETCLKQGIEPRCSPCIRTAARR